jgi:serine/threonine-protein kinase
MGVRAGTMLDGRYRLTGQLADGGTGAVWRAVDQVLDRVVAVKVLHPELAADQGFVRRFRSEARTVSGLPHGGIAAVYDYGEAAVTDDVHSPTVATDDAPVVYLVVELVVGEALSSILHREGVLSCDRTLDVVAQTARAVQAAHRRGVLHLGIQPGNVIVAPDGRVKVTDFGIAGCRRDCVTGADPIGRTAHYRAPELLHGAHPGPSSDVYALGVLAYECLAGRLPVPSGTRGPTPAGLEGRPRPLTVPAPVWAAVTAAMHKDPAQRTPSAQVLAVVLETLRR